MPRRRDRNSIKLKGGIYHSPFIYKGNSPAKRGKCLLADKGGAPRVSGCRASDWGIVAHFYLAPLGKGGCHSATMTGGSKIDFYIIKYNPTVTTKVVPPPLNLKEAFIIAPFGKGGCRASDWGIIPLLLKKPFYNAINGLFSAK